MKLMDRLLGKGPVVPAQRAAVLELDVPPNAVCCDGESVEIEVVGESFVQDYLWRLRGQVGSEAFPIVLVPEPSNPYDRWAVRVEVGGQLVGRLAKQTARAWHREVARVNAAGEWCIGSAFLVGGDEDRPHLGVFGTAVWPGKPGKAPERPVR